MRGRVLHAGEAAGPVLHLAEPLSFWGGFDPVTGAIIDIHHPQHGRKLGGAIVVMRESRGSGSAPGALAESIRRGVGPAGIILIVPDINLAVGAAVAETLYRRPCPVIAVDETIFTALAKAQLVRIGIDGGISLA
jgi:predicted aconitase with swiveling domain